MSGTVSQKSDDGGPAFPAPEASFAHFGTHEGYLGMTLRDYFAIELAKPLVAYALTAEDPTVIPDDAITKRAYGMADAMLKARQQ